jgi:hypothetical protein
MTYKSYKQRLNEELGLNKNTEHTMKKLKKITGIPIKILKEVNKRGIAAYYNNMNSVRLKEDFSKISDMGKGADKRLSVIQWSTARIYAFIYKSIFQSMRYKKQDLDLYDKIKHKFVT